MALSRGRILFLAGVAVAYAAYLAWYHAPYAGSSDASGYMNIAQLLLEGRLTTPLRVPEGLPSDILSREHLFPLGFRLDATQDHLLPTYPIGLPLHFAAIGLLTGLEPAVTVVGVGSALAFVILLYFTSREFGVKPGWSLGIACAGAVSPLTLHYALQPMSDLVAAAWTLVVVLGALRSSRHPGWAAVAGAAFAFAVLVRPANILLLLPAALALQPWVRTWFAFVLGGTPGALFLAGYNHALYGRYLTSGYGDVSSLFSTKHLLPTLGHFATWVPVVATPLVVAAAALPWLKVSWRAKAVLATWAGVFVVFYASYEPTKETWWYLRFILPALPALGIAAALALQAVKYPAWFVASRILPADATTEQLARGRILRLPVTVLLLFAAIGWSLYWSRALHVTRIELDDRAYRLTGQWVNEQLPRDAVLVAYQVSGALMYYTDRAFIVPNNLTVQEHDRLTTWLRGQKRELYAALYPHEESVLREKMPGQWEVVTRLRRVTLWRRLDQVAPHPLSP